MEREFVGRNILLVSPEDLIVNRLSAWVHWRSTVDGINSCLLYRARKRDLDEDRLNERIAETDVVTAYEAIISLYWKHGGEIPESREFEEWAQEIP